MFTCLDFVTTCTYPTPLEAIQRFSTTDVAAEPTAFSLSTAARRVTWRSTAHPIQRVSHHLLVHPTCRPALWLLQGVDVVIDDWIISQRGDNW